MRLWGLALTTLCSLNLGALNCKMGWNSFPSGSLACVHTLLLTRKPPCLECFVLTERRTFVWPRDDWFTVPPATSLQRGQTSM